MINKYLVSRDDAVYSAWPDVVLCPDGRLLCCFTECRHHGDRRDSRVMLVTSTDRGRTWSTRRPLSEVTQPPFYFNNCRLTLAPDGSVFAVCDRVDGSVGGEHGPGTVLYLWRSTDNGENWSAPAVLPMCGIVPDKLRFLSNGRVYLAAHNRSDSTHKLVEYGWYTDNFTVTPGEKPTWTRVTIAADSRYNLCEGCVLELPAGVYGDVTVNSGTLVCFMRENSGTGCDCLKAISDDYGTTWRGVYNVPIPGCHRPVAGLYDGGIMITHRFMQGGRGWLGSWTQNVFAAFTDVASAAADERKKQSVRIMPIDYDRSGKSDLGYTGWVRFDDGEFYVVNYIVDDAPVGQIRGYSFDMSDVII